MPEIAAELQGLSEMTGLEPLDLYLFSCFEFFDEGRTGCTSLGLTTKEGAVVAQNWDGPVGSSEELVALIHEDRACPFLSIASAGTLGWVGINAFGLAFVNNDLIVDKATNGMPSLVLRRLLLSRTCVADALGVLREHEHLSGRCFVIGDAAGALAAAEVSPRAGVAEMRATAIRHTNHPLQPVIALQEDIEEVARLYPSSRERLRAASDRPLRTVADIATILQDRTGAPDSICKSWSRREATETAFSVIFDCRRREAMIALGRPDNGAYEQIRLAIPAIA